MSYIAFIPGLEGHKSLANRTNEAVPGTYAYAVECAARHTNLPYARLDFQTAATPFPTLSDMGASIAGQIYNLNKIHGGSGLVVASSIGAGVCLQA